MASAPPPNTKQSQGLLHLRYKSFHVDKFNRYFDLKANRNGFSFKQCSLILQISIFQTDIRTDTVGFVKEIEHHQATEMKLKMLPRKLTPKVQISRYRLISFDLSFKYKPLGFIWIVVELSSKRLRQVLLCYASF